MHLSAPPLALYLHFPWCVSKCPYCDFNSHALHGELPQQAYLDALLADVAAQAGQVGSRNVGSLFLGGGTPSLFSPDAIGRLLEGLRERLVKVKDAEGRSFDHGEFEIIVEAAVGAAALADG